MSISIVFSMLTFFVGTAGWLLYPALMTELQDLGTLIKDAHAAGTEDANTKWPAAATVWRYLTAEFMELLRTSLTITSTLLSSFFYWIMAIVLAFFLLKDGHRIKKSALSWVPNPHLEMTVIVAHRTRIVTKRYLDRYFPVVILVGILSAAALHLLDVQFSLMLGAMAGLAQMIPYLGAVLGAIPAMLLVLADEGSVGAVLAVAVAFAAIEMIKNLVVSLIKTPSTLTLSPLSTLVALLVGVQILGIPGMLLAVPVASLSKIGLLELRKGMTSYDVL